MFGEGQRLKEALLPPLGGRKEERKVGFWDGAILLEGGRRAPSTQGEKEKWVAAATGSERKRKKNATHGCTCFQNLTTFLLPYSRKRVVTEPGIWGRSRKERMCSRPSLEKKRAASISTMRKMDGRHFASHQFQKGKKKGKKKTSLAIEQWERKKKGPSSHRLSANERP